jgi:nitroreductase
MKTNMRRNFLKKSLLAATGFLFLRNRSKANDHGYIHLIDDEQRLDNVANETIGVINNLHTTHGNFSQQEVPDADIEKVKQACIRAANSSNMQTYSIICVTDRKKIQDITTYEGSALLLFCIDYNRIIDCANQLGHSYYPDNMTSFVTACINTSIAAQTAVIAARSLGIDTLLTNGIHRGDMQRVWDILDLPQEQCFPLIALVLGYATEEAPYLMGRLDSTGIFHEDKYHRLNEAERNEIIAAYDNKENHLGLYNDWDKDGHAHYLDWLYTYWLGRAQEPTRDETPVFSFIKRSGFVES